MNHAREINPDTWIPVEEAVLCFIRDRVKHRILLIHKKTGLGAGLINAPGGRIEKGETPAEAAVRETEEEVGLRIPEPELRGHLYFSFKDGHSIRGYVFSVDSWEGEEQETREADPFWCSEDALPYQQMWADDSWWIPHLLAERPFSGRFIFDGECMLSMCLEVDAGNGESDTGIPRLDWSEK